MSDEKPDKPLEDEETVETAEAETSNGDLPEVKAEKTESPEEQEDEDGEEDALKPATIGNKRESHAPQIDINQLHSEPDFAAVCSFFNKFGTMIGLKPMPFTKLENMLTSFDSQGRVNKELVDLHLTLMRRIRMTSVRSDTWENYLKKFLALNDAMQGELFQLERYGYVHLPASTKIQILNALCEAQFDSNPKLKENMLAACKSVDLRLIPVGMDKSGLAYWFQQDVDFNIRIYTEEPDDLSGGTWTLVVRSADELDSLITRLKAEDLGYVKKEKKDTKENSTEPTAEEGGMVMCTKKGTFLDMCYDEAIVKKMREKLQKQKEERRNKREGKEEKESEKEEEVEEERPEDVEDHDMLDRRPRRSAASRAVTNIRKYASPLKKTPRKKKVTDDAEEAEDSKNSGDEKEKEGEGKAGSSPNSSSGSGDDDEDDFDSNEDEPSEDEDDEFRPKEARKTNGKRRRRRAKKKKLEMEEEEDDDDSDEEEVQKERKKATGEAACGQCKTSGDWDVLLLCDVCDDAWHTYCLKPMLWFVPDGDWFCPKCVHGMLIEKLEEVAKCLEGHLKKKSAEDKKKKAAADRLLREMEYIGVSLNNIIPSTLKSTAVASSSSSSDEDDGQRRCKRRAVRKIAPKIRSRFQMDVQTITEGRSRRSTKAVDYNFSEYDSVIQDACIELGEQPRPESREGEVVRPTGGAGRGKDMANIIEADQKRRGSRDESSVDGGADPPERLVGKPARTQVKHRRKLNDLDVDNQEDSDSEEYKANESEEELADADMPLSGSDYVPSDEERRRRRGGPRYREAGPTQSDEDFVVSGSDESDFGYRGRKKRRAAPVEKKKKKARWASDDETEGEASDSDGYSDDSEAERKRKKKQGKGAVAHPKGARGRGRWAAAASSGSEEEEEEEEVVEEGESEDEDAPRTQTGRPMRRAVAAAPSHKRTKDSDDSQSDEDEDEEESTTKKKDERPVGALNRPRTKIDSDSDSDEFKPEEEEDVEEEDEDEEEEENESEKKKKKEGDDAQEEKAEETEEGADLPLPVVPPLAVKRSASDSDDGLSLNVAKKSKRVEEDDEEAAPSIDKKPTVSALSAVAAKLPSTEDSVESTPTPLPSVKKEPFSAAVSAPVIPVKSETSAPAAPAPATDKLPSSSVSISTVPPAVPYSYASAGPSPYPTHNPYYKGTIPSGSPHALPGGGLLPPHLMHHPPYSMAGGPPPAGYPSPYGPPPGHPLAPPTSHWQQPGGRYGPMPPPHNPYGPVPSAGAPVHNPYGQPPSSATNPSGTNLNDLQSL